MPRNDKTLLSELSLLPWWALLLLSVFSYVVLKFIVPEIDSSNIFINSIAKASPTFAPFVSGLILMVAAVASIKSWQKGILLDGQRDIKTIKEISWREFEELVGEVYRRKGYEVIESNQNGPDGGVDLILKKNGEVIFVQCKQWRLEKVGVKLVRELFGVMAGEGATGGIVISSGSFTNEAMQFVKSKPIEVIGGDELFKMISEVKKAKSIGAPSNATKSNICPACGSDMVLRTAKKGVNVGEKFWGCSTYPKCKTVIKISV